MKDGRLAAWMGWVAVATTLAAGAPFLFELAATPSLLARPRHLVALAAFALFVGLLFLPEPEEGSAADRRRALAALGVQSAAAVLLVHAYPQALFGVLVVIVAAGAGELLALGAALVWVAVQSLAMAAAFVPVLGLGSSLLVLAAYGGFQVFAAYAAHVAVRERRARRELARVNDELAAARELLAESSRAGERLRIARDLHDTLGHHLTALSLALEAARHAPAGQAAAEVERARGLARTALGEVRAVVGRLRDEGEGDLAAALAGLAGNGDRPRVHLTVDPALRRVADGARAEALLRCAQEVVTNARRHSGAANLWLELARRDGGVVLEAADDGVGAAVPLRPGFGLAGMRERLEQLGGRLTVDARPGDGFRVRAWLPGAAA